MDKIGDKTVFHMLTDMVFTKGHVFDTIYVDLTYEVKENWKDSEKQGYTLIVKFNCNGKSNGCMAMGVITREYLTCSTTNGGKKWVTYVVGSRNALSSTSSG